MVAAPNRDRVRASSGAKLIGVSEKLGETAQGSANHGIQVMLTKASLNLLKY